MFNDLLVEPLVNALLGIYAFIPGHDFGIAVIILTILVRLALWPLVTKQLHSQKVLQQLQPEVAKIKAKAKGDKHKETQLLMELYKEKGTNPFASLLPLIVQLPIFLALFYVFRDAVNPDAIAKIAYEPIKQLPIIADIISHKVQFHPALFGLIDLTKANIFIALLAGAAQYYQSVQLQPKKEHMDDQAKMMSGLIKFFPIITIVIAMTLPSALALYWAFTSIVAIIQQYLVLHRDARELEESA